MHHSPFTVAGMSSSTTTHHSPNLNTWGSTSTTTAPFTDSLSQSRSHYQPGYLMSTSQSNNAPQGNQRIDEAPMVQTKAKMNHALSRGSAVDFGMDSMFQSTRQRQALDDEDAPPMNSINDIPNEIHVESTSTRFQQRKSTLENSQYLRRSTRSSISTQSSQPLYVIVFGYPADKYSLAVEYFKSLGEATEPDQNTEIVNCFRIGYKDSSDAMRAVRKNGEILGGHWMVGAKWADPAQAEAILGLPVLRANVSLPPSDTNTNNAMSVDESPSFSGTSTPSVGTPIRLAPSTSAFRKGGSTSKPSTPQGQHGWGTVEARGTGLPSGVTPGTAPNKGVLGQVSDLIFGW